MPGPGGEQIGSGYVQVGIDDSDLDRGLAKAEADVAQSMKRMDSMRARPEIEADIHELERDVIRVRRELVDLDRQKVDPEVGLDTSEYRRKKALLQADLKELAARKTEIRVEATELREATRDVRDFSKALKDSDKDIDRNDSILRRWGKSLTRIRIHVGVASLTIKQLGIVLATLGPILSGLVGASVAVIGSLGAGIAGAAAIGAAGLTGFGLSAIGIMQALRPAREEMKLAMDAFGSFDEAVREFGRGSEEAREAQKEMNAVLKNVSPAAAGAARAFVQLRSAWEGATGPTRTAFFEGIQASLGAATRLMPMFARETNKTAKTASTAWQGWMDTLRSSAVRDALANTLGNFRQALPAIAAGVENLTVAFLNLSSTASNALPNIARGFRDWSAGLRRTTSDATGFQQTIDNGVSSFQTWMTFLGSAGRLLVTFFSAGRNAGDGLLRTLTATFDRWTSWMQTVEGRSSLADFFQQASSMASVFISALAQVGQILFNIAQITAPITQAFLDISRVFADAANWVLGLDGVRQALTGIVSVLAVGAIVGRVSALAVALGALAGIGSKLRTVAPAAAGIGAAMATTRVATVGAAAGATGLGAALGKMMGRINPVTAGLTALASAAIFGFKEASENAERLRATADTVGVSVRTLDHGTAQAKDGWHQLAEAIREADAALADLAGAAGKNQESQTKLTQAARDYNDAVEEHGPKSDQAYKALYRLQGLNAKAADSLTNLRAKREAATAEDREAVEVAREQVKAARDVIREQKQYRRAKGGAVFADPMKLEQLTAAEKALTAAQNARALSGINQARVMNQNREIAGKAEAEVARFARAFRNVPNAKKLAINTNSRQAVGELAKVSNEAKKVAGKKSTVRILADSGSAQEAIVRLQRLIDRVVKRKFKASVDLDDNASGKLPPILAKILSVVGPKWQATLEGNATPVGNALSLALRLAQRWQGTSWAGLLNATTGGVSSGLASAISMGLSWAGRVFTAILNVKRTGNFAGGIEGPTGFARGGDPRTMARALAAAGRAAPMDARGGGRTSRPRYVTGEENQREYIIAMNPAYRKSNEMYLRQAAAEMGLNLTQGFAKGGLFGPRSKYEGLKHQIDLSEQMFSNMQRHHEEGLALGQRYPLPSMETLLGQKQNTIEGVDSLIQHIDKRMVPGLKKQIRKDPRFKPRKQPKRRKGENNKEYRKRVKDWRRDEKGRKKDHRQKEKDKDNTRRDQIPELLREIDFLKQDRYNFVLDLEALRRGDLPGAGGGAGGPTIGEQIASLNVARFDLFREFGSNVSGFAAQFGSSAAGAFSAATPGLAAQVAAGGPGVTSPTATAQSASGPTQQTFVNNFAAPPPDPHTWSQEMAWEAGTVG